MLLALVLSACTRDVLHVELPPEQGARAALIAVESRGNGHAWQLDRLIALDLDAPPTADLLDLAGDDARRTLRLTALYYAEDLDALAIDPGPVEIAPAGRTRKLPGAREISRRILSSTVTEDWQTLTALPESLADVEISAEALVARICVRPEVTSMLVEEGTDIYNSAFAVEVGAFELLGDEGGGLLLVDRDGRSRVVTPVTTATSTTPPVLWHARPWPGGEVGTLLCGGTGGRIWRGVLDEAALVLHLELWGEDARAGRIYRLEGGLGPEGLEVFSIGKEGTFGRWIGGRFTPLTTYRPTLDARPRTGVKWLGPGEGVGFYWTSNALARFAEGRYAPEVITVTEGRVLTMADVLPRYGLVVADEAGEVFAANGRSWTPLGDWGYGEPFEIDAVASWGDGLVAVGRNGLLAVLDPRIGFCPADNVAISTILQIEPWGDDLLLLGEHAASKNRRLVYRLSRP